MIEGPASFSLKTTNQPKKMTKTNNPVYILLKNAGKGGITIDEMVTSLGKSRSAVNQMIVNYRDAWHIKSSEPEPSERKTKVGATIKVKRYRLDEKAEPQKQEQIKDGGIKSAVLSVFNDGKNHTRQEILKGTPFSESGVNGALAELCRDGRLHRVGLAQYSVSKPAVNQSPVQPVDSQPRRTKIFWNDDELSAIAEAVFLELLVDPTIGVNNSELLMRAMQSALPKERWRVLNGVSQVEGMLKYLKPKLEKWSNSWLDPEIVSVEVEREPDIAKVLEQADELQLVMALTKLRIARTAQIATQLVQLIVGQKELAEHRYNEAAPNRVLIPTTVVHPTRATPRVFIAGIKKNRLREILEKVEGPLEIIDAWYCDDKEKRTHSAKDVPVGADVYFINTRQSGHTDQAAVKEKLNTQSKHLLRWSIGTHPLELYLKEIAKDGIETFMAKPHMYKGS
ncbi:hypothetical protein [Acinetobacter sp.]|uniref:hypothetical protein n=1 Tax=Acinetobacter sp. TaxID=472 RepID=UPI0037520EC3